MVQQDFHAEKMYSPFPLINAVLTGAQDGFVFSDSGFDFIIHKAGFSWLNDREGTNCTGWIDFFLRSERLPGYFHIYDAPAELTAACNAESERINTRLRTRIQLKFKDRSIQQLIRPVSGYQLVRIGREEWSRLEPFALSIGEKFWRSEDDFLANGFGFVVKDEAGVPASVCYAACVADGTAEIDVATLPEHRNKGLARMAVAGFVQHCLENRMTANWDCFVDNTGSLRTAESLGFQRIFSYNFLSIFNKTKNNETQRR